MIIKQSFDVFLSNLQENSVDLILTDPPYNISRETRFHQGKSRVRRLAISMDFGEWDHKEIDIHLLSKLAFKSLRDGGTAIIFYDLWKLSYLAEAMKIAGFRMIRLLIWEKTNPVPINSQINYLTGSREIAVLGVKGKNPTFHSEYDNGVYQYPIARSGKHNRHPTQKPLDLFTEIVKKHSNTGDLVVDCFVGSGTTALACLNTDRRFTGCDISDEYIKIAKVRLECQKEEHGLLLNQGDLINCSEKGIVAEK